MPGKWTLRCLGFGNEMLGGERERERERGTGTVTFPCLDGGNIHVAGMHCLTVAAPSPHNDMLVGIRHFH